MLQHEAMVIRLLQLPYLFLKRKHMHYNQLPSIKEFALSSLCSTHLVLDLPPRQLTNQELHHHVEQRPQVIMPSHFL